MNKSDHKQILIELGQVLQNYLKGQEPDDPCGKNTYDSLLTATREAEINNPWFTSDNIRFSLEVWAETLTHEKIKKWLNKYNIPTQNSQKTGIIAAGNIPLVGLHDLLSVWVSGHEALIKQSSDDRYLLPVFAQYLLCKQSTRNQKIHFVEKLTDFDAVIATGSNNTARYFEYYFSHVPHIIRRNRNAIAVLTGNETEEELTRLGEDIFRYFGLGCRSVSKLFVPEGYKWDNFFEAVFAYKDLIHHHKYHNNYLYHKTLYLMNKIPLLENGFLLLKEDPAYASPVSVLHYEYYDSIALLKARLQADAGEIQCVVSVDPSVGDTPIGKSQFPELWEYADGVDTMEFLINLG